MYSLLILRTILIVALLVLMPVVSWAEEAKPSVVEKPASAALEKPILNEVRILSVVVGGLALWFLKEGLIFLRKSRNLRVALLNEIQFFVADMEETVKYLQSECGKMKEMECLEYAGYYTNHKALFFHEMTGMVSEFLSGDEFIKVTKAYRAIDEFHILVTGFFTDTMAWKVEKRELTESDINLLKRRSERISRIYSVFQKTDIKSLKDLPVDYYGMLNALDVRG